MPISSRFGGDGKALECVMRQRAALSEEGQWVPFAALPAKMSFPPPAGQKEEEPRKDRVNGNRF